MRSLTTSERAHLEFKLKKTKDLSEWKRIFAVVSFDSGDSIEAIADALRISTSTVETYLREYDSKNKTKHDPRGGSESKLTSEESQKSGMTAWLNDHCFTFKQPEKIPGKVNPEVQEKFIEEYQKLKENLTPNEELYFIDAVHPEYQSQAVCGWIKKGECKTLQTKGKQLRLPRDDAKF